MYRNEPVMTNKYFLFAKANNDQKFFFIGGIATKILFMDITGSFLYITVQKENKSVFTTLHLGIKNIKILFYILFCSQFAVTLHKTI